jgi:hypothetical protein
MKNNYLILFFCFFTFTFFAQDYSRVKIYADEQGMLKLSELGLAVDHGTQKQGHFFISDFSTREIQILKDNGYNYEILIDDVQKYYVDQNLNLIAPTKNAVCPNNAGTIGFDPITPANFQLGTMGGFYKYNEMLDQLTLMQQMYPNLISVRAGIDTFHTVNDSLIYWVRISDNPTIDESGEKELLYTAVHHAREPNSMTSTIFYMWYLLENYATSAEIQHLINDSELYFVPCLNPDGYIYNETTNPSGGGMHRKNRRNVGTTNKGVDLNRNYSYGWGTTGISFNVNNDTYPGTGAFSEVETQAMKWFCENHDFKLAFNAHTYGDLLLFPIGTTTAELAIHHNYFNRFTGYMVQYNGFANQKSSALYPASGDSDDYMYNDDLANKPRIFAMTPEIGNDSDGFWPAQNKIIPNSKNMVFPNMMLAHIAHRYLIVEDQDPERLATATGVFNHVAERIGMDTGVVIVQIQPLQNITSVGAPVSYNLALITPQAGTFSYTLATGVAINDTVKYVLETVYPTWTKRDTIVKLFGTYPSIVFDDATTATNWTGNWTTESHTVYSASKAFSDSESGSNATNYQNNSTKTYEYVNTIDLTNASYADVTFFAKWDIEADYDYCQFQVSIDGGTTWIGQCGLYTVPGTSGGGSVQPNNKPVYEGTKNWVREEISLSDYLGESIKVRFIIEADGGVNQDGFYFDDFTIHKGTAGIGLPENELFFTVYPNPSKANITISSSANLMGSLYSILDANGKVMQSNKIDVVASEYQITTSTLADGVYTLVLTNEAGIATAPKRIVILK